MREVARVWKDVANSKMTVSVTFGRYNRVATFTTVTNDRYSLVKAVERLRSLAVAAPLS